MESQSLPTKSEIYNQKNPQIEQSGITMNIYGPPPINNIENEEQSNVNINQTEETFVINNINQFSLDKVDINRNNYPLTENRNESPAPLTFEKKGIVYNSINPNGNYMKKKIITNNQQRIKNNVINVNQNKIYINQIIVGEQQTVENNNAITVPITNTNINPQHHEEKNDESECDDICCCIIKIICFLNFLPLILLFYCIIFIFCSDSKDDCFHCFKKKKRR